MNMPDCNRLMKEFPRGGKLLLHVCCAPCASGVLDRLDGFAVVPYFYNPNIDTSNEYFLRAAQFEKLGVKPVVERYDHGEFCEKVKGLEDMPEGGERCRRCIELRLRRTAQKAAEIGADVFCSTLSVSPHKDAVFINEAGKRLEAEYGVKFLPNDFKKENGFLLSVQRSKAAGMYRQDYCGCEFAKNRSEQNARS